MCDQSGILIYVHTGNSLVHYNTQSGLPGKSFIYKSASSIEKQQNLSYKHFIEWEDPINSIADIILYICKTRNTLSGMQHLMSWQHPFKHSHQI